MLIYNSLLQAKRVGEKKFGVLIDPDKQSVEELDIIADQASQTGVDFFLVGGSLILHDQLELCIKKIRSGCTLPILLFPGDHYQISSQADGILLLSLISGRNADLLIGKHVIAAPYLKETILEKLAFLGTLKTIGKGLISTAKGKSTLSLAQRFGPGKAWGQAKGLGHTFFTQKGRAGLAKKWAGLDETGRQELVGKFVRKAALPAAYTAGGLYVGKKVLAPNRQPQPYYG